MKKKVIIIFSGYFLPHLGGVERYVDKVSRALQRKGHKVIIVTSQHQQALKHTEVIDGIKVYRLPILKIASGRYPIPRVNRTYQKLIQSIENEQADVFLLNTRFHLMSLVGARMAKQHGAASYLIEHGTAHFSVGVWLLDKLGIVYEHALTAIMKRYVKNFYGVSKKCNDWLKHYNIQAKGVFYNAISPDDAKGVKQYDDNSIEAGDIVISYAGRLIKEKGILNLIEAFQFAQKQRPTAKLKLVIAGDGPLMQSIQADYKHNKAIHLLGQLNFEQIKSLYKRTDIFVYPSLYPEGLPTSILEAGLMGCAVIATPKGGTEEVIGVPSHGIIVNGAVDSLTKALLKLVDDPAKRSLLGANVRKRVTNHFSWSKVVDTIEREIEKHEA